MYNLKFESETTGKSLVLNYENGIIIRRVDGATGSSVSLGLAQGYQQVGQSVISATIGGMSLTISGYVLDRNTAKKEELLQTFAPFTKGRLWWEDKYFVEVEVKDSPTISQTEHSSFSFRLFSQSPFWSLAKKLGYTSGDTTAEFSFPKNFSTPHRFGTKDFSKEYNVFNSGNVETAFELRISGTSKVVNPKIVNNKTGDFISFTGNIEVGEALIMRQSPKAVFVSVEHIDGSVTNEFAMLDDDSSLFKLKVGDNLISNNAEQGADGMISEISFYPLKSGVLANGV